MSFSVIFDNGDGMVLEFNNGEWVSSYTDVRALVADVIHLINDADPVADNWDSNLEAIDVGPDCVCINDDEVYTFDYDATGWKTVVQFGEQFRKMV